MIFWASAVQTAAKLESLRQAETKLLAFAKAYGSRSPNSYDIQVFDTKIPRSPVPLRPLPHSCVTSKTTKAEQKEEDSLVIHGVSVISKQPFDETNTTKTPLVLLHGYMNASAYFYRNLVGLSHYFQNIFSLDLLGWGLSSRPAWSQLKDGTVETAEAFYVESLEQWRKKQQIETMILAGHSMGGYIAVAYCERYPERVERLILLSPVGVQDEQNVQFQEQRARLQSTLRSRFMFGLFETLFHTTTVGSFLRTLPEARANKIATNYVERRLPEISSPEEQTAVADYLFHNATLPGSGEYCIQKFLQSNILAYHPLQHRIPKLKVSSTNFLYGTTDWMPLTGGLTTQILCEQSSAERAPTVNVFVVRDAGHLLMLQNWNGFNAAVIHAAGGTVPEDQLPIHVTPSDDLISDHHSASTTTTVKNQSQPQGSRPHVTA